MSDVHTERYNDAKLAPVIAVNTASAYVQRDWGDNYRIGYIGHVMGARIGVDASIVHLFQVVSADGSRFVVWADKWGVFGTAKGRKALATIQSFDIEAYVAVDDS